MRPVPEINEVDLAFGEIGHLPPMDEIPAEFHRSSNVYCQITMEWFFNGLKEPVLSRLIPKEGVDKLKALRAISAILKSWGPKHEHKEAGTGYLLSEWFTILPETQAA